MILHKYIYSSTVLIYNWRYLYCTSVFPFYLHLYLTTFHGDVCAFYPITFCLIFVATSFVSHKDNDITITSLNKILC